jgi:hypothetical protein
MHSVFDEVYCCYRIKISFGTILVYQDKWIAHNLHNMKIFLIYVEKSR